MSSDSPVGQPRDESWRSNGPDGRTVFPSWRVEISNWLSLVSLGCLLTSPTVVAYLFWYAYQLKLYPHPADVPSPVRGPWSGREELIKGIILLINPLLYTFVFGLLSVMVKPNWRAWVVLALNVLFCFFSLSLVGLAED